MAYLTTAYNSDGFGNLQDICKATGIDKLVAEPDFTTKDGYYYTAFKGDKFKTIRFTDHTVVTKEILIDHIRSINWKEGK